MMLWQVKNFQALSLDEFYQILKLRIDVFVVEQQCAYHEIDGKDKIAKHVFKVDENGKICAYARLFDFGDEHVSFGRFVVHPRYRKQSLGHELINYLIGYLEKNSKGLPIKISAQTYLEKFYKKHGFNRISAVYLDDGIQHIDMVKNW